MKWHIIAALASNHVIGSDGHLPWSLPKDMAHFKRTTQGHIVLMGRRTYESCPARFRPLSNRYSLVLSGNTSYSPADLPPEAGCVVHSVNDALKQASQVAATGKWPEEVAFVIGGGQIYAQTIACVERLILTHVQMAQNRHYTAEEQAIFSPKQSAVSPGLGEERIRFPSYGTSWSQETRTPTHPADSRHTHDHYVAWYRKNPSSPPLLPFDR